MVNIMLEGAERKARNKLISDAVHNEDLENDNDANAEKYTNKEKIKFYLGKG